MLITTIQTYTPSYDLFIRPYNSYLVVDKRSKSKLDAQIITLYGKCSTQSNLNAT